MAGPSLTERLSRIENMLQYLAAQAESAAGFLHMGRIVSFAPETYTATIELEGGRTVNNAVVSEHIRKDMCKADTVCVVAIFDDKTYVIATVEQVPWDPFDPIIGHRHTGLAGDGPVL